MISIRSIILILLSIDLLLGLITLSFYEYRIFLTMQIGFISATLIMLGSMISYRRMINTRIEHNIISIDDSKDIIDTLEDPYDVYSEEEIIHNPDADLLETVKEERAKLKANKRSLIEILKDSKASLSAYRLLAYVFLILGFLYLNRHNLLDIPSYLLALGLVPSIIVILLLKAKNKSI